MCGSATTGRSGGCSSGSGRVCCFWGTCPGVGLSFAFADQREATNTSQSWSFDFWGFLCCLW
ncbi:hypothetical protein PspLS_05556 [Pyricularia sp. CBS 133598]|nr:hypothetical protein PspLS_05556 [Pyricularia sp. CBS 133598]